jgi:hypothetical protein
MLGSFPFKSQLTLLSHKQPTNKKTNKKFQTFNKLMKNHRESEVKQIFKYLIILSSVSGGVCTPCPPGYYGTLDNPLGVRTFV